MSLRLCLSFSLSLFPLSVSLPSVYQFDMYTYTYTPPFLPSLQLFFFLCELSLKGILSLFLLFHRGAGILWRSPGAGSHFWRLRGIDCVSLFALWLSQMFTCYYTTNGLLGCCRRYVESIKQQKTESTFNHLVYGHDNIEQWIIMEMWVCRMEHVSSQTSLRFLLLEYIKLHISMQISLYVE